MGKKRCEITHLKSALPHIKHSIEVFEHTRTEIYEPTDLCTESNTDDVRTGKATRILEPVRDKAPIFVPSPTEFDLEVKVCLILLQTKCFHFLINLKEATSFLFFIFYHHFSD